MHTDPPTDLSLAERTNGHTNGHVSGNGGGGGNGNGSGNGIERLFEMTSDLLAEISLDGRFTLLNPAWEQVLGWSIEELMAQPMHERVHPGRRRADAGADARRPQPPGAARELHQPLPPPRRLVALAAVERALRRRGLVRGRQGRDRPDVAGAPGAARPADQAAQPAAADGPRAPGARAPAPQPRADRAAVHRPRPVQGDQRQPRPRGRRPPADLGRRAPRRR